MPKIEAIIFDVDGVLVDAREWHYEALNRALALFGMNINRYQHLSAYDGLPTAAKLDLMSRDNGLPRGLHGFIKEIKQAYTMELINVRCKPVFALEFALSRLRAQGYRLGVASNAVRESVETMMRLSNLSQYFEFMLSNEDVRQPKPHPEIYARAMEKIGCAPERCLVVEDNDHGVQAAQAAGARVYRVASPADVTFENIARVLSPAQGAP